ncbi:hypothetical protein LCGC14_1577360, partial [marine sediment metagenome]
MTKKIILLLFLFAVQANAALVARWTMDDNAANTVVLDSEGTHNGVASQNTVDMTAAGTIGTSLAFNGTTDDVTIAPHADLTLKDSNFTFSVWVYITGQGGGGLGTGYIFGKSSARYLLRVLQEDSNDVKIRGRIDYEGLDASDATAQTTARYPFNTWTHIAMVFSQPSITLYIDGIAVPQGQPDGVGTMPDDSAGDFVLGNRYQNASYGFDGRIDDARLYDTALSEDDVRALAGLEPLPVETEVGSNYIKQYYITWTFDDDIATDTSERYQYGTFANDDYWIRSTTADANVTIITIDPNSFEVASRTKNGSVINPTAADGRAFARVHGYDSAKDGYNAATNVAKDVSVGSPLVVPTNSSLLSSVSNSGEQVNQIETIAILTVLSTAPASGSFRPPYCGTDKTINYNISALDYSSLGSLVPTASAPAIADVCDMIKRPWVDYFAGSFGKGYHPTNNMETYGRDISVQMEDIALMLQTNIPDNEKAFLMVRLTQLGIDNYGVVTSDPCGTLVWVPDGGHGLSRKFPIMFAGTVLNDATLLSVADKSGDYLRNGSNKAGDAPADYTHFQEDAATYYVTSDDIYPTPYDLEFKFSCCSPIRSMTTGTVKVTNGNAIVEGVGTEWATLNAEDPDWYRFGVEGDNLAFDPNEFTSLSYYVTSIDSNTQLTLAAVYAGDTDISGTATYAVAETVTYGHSSREYVASDSGLPEWGIRHSLVPRQDNPAWDNSSYRYANSDVWIGWVLAAQIMGMKSTWNHDALFDYTD